jgi:hypothetical protein
MAKTILGLRGVTRAHLCSVADDFDVYLETCHQAEPGDDRAFCVNGSRYVVVDSRDEKECCFAFPTEVEEYIEAKVNVRDMEKPNGND